MSRDKVVAPGMQCRGKGTNTRCALTLGILPLASLLIGCAVSPAPASISASYVSSIPYQSWTCSQLRQEQSSLDAALSSASTQQDQMRSNERVHSALSMLVPLPPDTGFGDVTLQVDIAHLKGEQEAVRQAAVHNSCPTEAIQSPNVLPASRNPTS